MFKSFNNIDIEVFLVHSENVLLTVFVKYIALLLPLCSKLYFYFFYFSQDVENFVL